MPGAVITASDGMANHRQQRRSIGGGQFFDCIDCIDCID
jgi:hypothetical protein